MKPLTPETMLRRAVISPTTGRRVLIVVPALSALPTCQISSTMVNLAKTKMTG